MRSPRRVKRRSSWLRCWQRLSRSSLPADGQSRATSESRWSFSIPRPVLNPDRCSNKTKGFANLILQESLIGKVQLHCAVGEQDERRRRHVGLRHIENLHALAHRDRCAFEVHLLEKAIHFAGADALPAFA